MGSNRFRTKSRHGNAILILGLLLSIAIYLISNQYLLKGAEKKNEILFNENQLIQTEVVATAIQKELTSLNSFAEILSKCTLPRMVKGEISIAMTKNLLDLQVEKASSIEGYCYVSIDGSKDLASFGKNESAYLEDLSGKVDFSRLGKLRSSFLLESEFTRKQQLLAVVFPVIVDDVLHGGFVQVINLRPIIDLYVAPLRSGKYGAGYLLSSNGTILYDHEPEVIGENIFGGLHDDYPELLELDHELVSRDSGKAEYSFTVKRSEKVSRKLISWSTAHIGNERLVVCLSAPDIEIDATLFEVRVFQSILQALLMVILGILVYLIIRRRTEQAVRENERRLVLAFEGNRDGVWEWNVNTSEVYFSSRWKEMLGYRDDEIEPSLSEWEIRIHPEDRDKVCDDLNNHLEGRTDFYENEHRVRCKDGSYKWILDRGKVYASDCDGNPEWMIGTHTDITEKKRDEFEIRKLSKAVESSPSAVVITDPVGIIQYVNKTFEDITGYSAAEVLGKSPAELIKSDRNRAEVYHELWKTVSAGNCWRGELVNVTKYGEEYWCRLSVSPVFNRQGILTNYVGNQEDLTELKKKEAELQRLATTDDLTGIVNRRRFIEVAQNEMNRSRRYGYSMALSIIDIDHFKVVNDTYGHDFGDLVLKGVAGLIESVVRDIDTFGRIGGEEFALLLPESDWKGAATLLERLRVAVEEHFFDYYGESIGVTASFGCAIYMGSSSDSLGDLMKRADRALYAAKEQGRNKSVCSESFEQES